MGLMRLGITDHLDCAHLLPGHPKCGRLHGHTYRVEVVVDGETRDGMVVDFADLKSQVRAVLRATTTGTGTTSSTTRRSRTSASASPRSSAKKLAFPLLDPRLRGSRQVGRDAREPRGRGGDRGMMRIDEALRPADLRPAIDRMWEISAEQDPLAREDLERRRTARPSSRCAGATPPAAGPTGRRASSSARRCCSSTPPATRAFLELGRERTFERMAPHLTHMGVHDHGFNNVSTYGALRRLMLEGRYEPDGRERELCELALKVSGAVQARRWTRSADGGGFIYSFNGPHSLFADTMRSLRALALAHCWGTRCSRRATGRSRCSSGCCTTRARPRASPSTRGAGRDI